MKRERHILAEHLAAQAAEVMPKHQAKRFAAVVTGKRRDTTPEIPPITVDRPFRPSPLRPARPKRTDTRQGLLL